MDQFQASLAPRAETTIIDVGGYPSCWSAAICPARITLVNLHIPEWLDSNTCYPMIKGDGCNLQFSDESFDIGYSNSVIEHLSTFENQQKFAQEIRRVGKRIWVQTPARWFFVEPHLITPLIHYLPKKWQRGLLRHFTVWGWITKPSQKQVDEFLQEVRLLTYKEMQLLFPDCQIRRERFLGMTKSFIAIR
jgi:hypothetical protein